MRIIDAKGRIFGKVSILDLGAIAIILAVLVGIFIFPGTSGTSIAQGKTEPIEVDVLVRGLSVGNSEEFFQQLTKENKANIIIRNQPAGQVEVKKVEPLPRTTPVPQPDGSVKALPDPRPEVKLIKDMIITLAGNAQITKEGEAVLSGTKKIKIGTPLQLEGNNYDFNGSTIAIRRK
ncbi:MAG: DUF4330 domain-containing protein [Cyanobacteria bacterium J083]|nr:MAG: DUF4330 domain-containing protein [Cyanobacteria bacterium J083]